MKSIALIGDSHLAYLFELADQLAPPGYRIDNRAVGGADIAATRWQIRRPAEHFVLSVGANDSVLYRGALNRFVRGVDALIGELPAPVVYLKPPPFLFPDDSLAQFSEAGCDVVARHGGIIVDTPALLAPIGEDGYVWDGVHLSPAGYAAVIPGLRQAIAAAVRGPATEG